MKFFDEVGKVALGTRVRFLAEKISMDATEIYNAYGANLQPKWFPVFHVLSQNHKNTITSIASYIGHSHASVSKIIAEMSKAGLIIEKTDAKDRRSTIVSLTKKGKESARKMEPQYADVKSAIEELSSQATHDLWKALEEWEYLLGHMPLRERVLKKKKQRESAMVKVEPYQPKYEKAFRALNQEWITSYFTMEKMDSDVLENPKKYILDRGGFIFVATIEKKPVGVCSLIWRDDVQAYELSKMAVSKEERGKNIGFMLGKAAIQKAISLKADRVFLESNTILKPAIRLYEKLGFKKIVGPPTHYDRCNIQMELKLNHD